MNKVYLSATVNEDDSLTIPAFAVRGLGYEPGETVHMTLPVQTCICDCDDNELFLSRCCGESECGGYHPNDILHEIIASNILRAVIAQVKGLTVNDKAAPACFVFQFNQNRRPVHVYQNVHVIPERWNHILQTNPAVGIGGLNLPGKGVMEVRLGVKHRTLTAQGLHYCIIIFKSISNTSVLSHYITPPSDIGLSQSEGGKHCNPSLF